MQFLHLSYVAIQSSYCMMIYDKDNFTMIFMAYDPCRKNSTRTLNLSKTRTMSSLIVLTIIIDKIFETNSTFYVKQCTTRKVYLFFKRFLLVLTKFSFAQGAGRQAIIKYFLDVS